MNRSFGVANKKNALSADPKFESRKKELGNQAYMF